MKKLLRFIKIHGLVALFVKLFNLPIYRIKFKINKKKNEQKLKNIINNNKYEKIIIFYSPVPWNLPLHQRPHHLALKFANLNYLYFYCTNNPIKDDINGFVEITSNCFLTDQIEALLNIGDKKIIHLYSTDMRDISKIYSKLRKNKDIVLYEYIDELHEDITGKIPLYVFKNHFNILKDEENCIVIASADKLLNDVKESRSKNYRLVTNGVDLNHFTVQKDSEIPVEITNIVSKKNPIIGYFGAFASWFDYELIKKIALERPEYELLLIGWDYDRSISNENLGNIPNINIIGPIDYKILPNYAKYFDVSTIPFKINEVTESTSPVKLFEYMALGKPIVTTDMVECRKYETVLIGKSHEDFIKKIDLAIGMKSDTEYIAALKKDAFRNDWEFKASEIKSMLENVIK